MSIEQTASGKYRAVVRYQGQKRSGKPRATRQEAKQDEAALTLEMASATSPAGINVASLVRDHMNRADYSPTTRVLYERVVKMLPYDFMVRRCNEVTTPMVVQALATLESKEYRRKARNLLAASYKRGLQNGSASINPVRDVQSEQSNVSEVVPPSVEDVKVLIKLAAETNPSLGVLVRLAAHTGLRRSELIALQWQDLVGQALIIRRSLVMGEQRLTKTGRKAHRRIAISQEVLEALQTLPRDSEWMFSRDGKPWDGSYVTQALTRLGVNPHALRHFCATQMLGQGFSIVDVGHRLGDSPMTIARVYAWWLPDRDRAAADALPV